MNEGRPYLQMWRGVWVSFCKIVIVSFLSVRYSSDALYCRMAGTPSSPTLFFIRVEISISNTSKRPMRCMEHQDAVIRVVYLVGDEDERGKSLSANVEGGAGIFLQNCHSLLSIRQI